MNSKYKNEENASPRGGDEESTFQHIGDVDVRSTTTTTTENNNEAAAKSCNYKYKFLTLIGVVLLVTVITLSIGLLMRSNEEKDSTTNNNDNQNNNVVTVGAVQTEAGNEQMMEMEEDVITNELVDQDDGNDVLSSFAAGIEMESMAPSTMPSVQTIIITSSPTMSPMQPTASPVTSPPTSNPTTSPVTSYPTTSPVMDSTIVSNNNGDDFFGLGTTLFGNPEEAVDVEGEDDFFGTLFGGTDEETVDGGFGFDTFFGETEETVGGDDFFGESEETVGDDDGGCYDGLAEVVCCFVGFLC